MTLYTCGQTTHGAAAGHPCARAARALDQAGHRYELEPVGGYKLLPWTRRGQRGKIRELSGQEDVPVLVLDGGEVVAGTRSIIDWAKSNPA